VLTCVLALLATVVGKVKVALPELLAVRFASALDDCSVLALPLGLASVVQDVVYWPCCMQVSF
jgi:hypothetical protein